jgi:lipopolysaccharide transport system ATP-binding protein
MCVIKVENLSKKYVLDHRQREQCVNLRDVLTEKLWNACRKITYPFASRHAVTHDLSREEFWALKDVSFEIKQGERLGIIGRNGAGKSTLLKILSRITAPTSGKVSIKGRVASLLEVGTGFNGELSGRENIYLNGAILGMSRQEIRLKFDEIVAFAEVEKFLDTPVKRYSSGMYVRLAFAVAAHLEPEILIVDEVLAVGDAQFQKRCLGKMEDVSTREGRTVLFVSHNMSAIKALCNKCLVLDSGQIKYCGSMLKAVEIYLESGSKPIRDIPVAERKRDRKCSLRAKIIDVIVSSEQDVNPDVIDSTKPLIVKYVIKAFNYGTKVSMQIIIADDMQNIIYIDSGSLSNKIYELDSGITEVECTIAPTYLYAGNYKLHAVLSLPYQETIDYVSDAYLFSVRDLDPYRSGFNMRRNTGFGIYHADHTWGASNPRGR